MLRRDAHERPRVVACSLEGSQRDANAVEVARQLALLARARLALVAVAPVRVPGDRWDGPTWTAEEARHALELTAASLGDDVDCYLELGNPIRRLTEFAKASHALLLVVASSDSADRPASIVARGVARSAPCPVVIVPETAPVPLLAAASDG